MSSSSPNARDVFVVYGRNESARKAMFEFLRTIGLNPLEWSQLVSATGKGSPYIGEILQKGFELANAAVVLLTPDDEARLKKEFWKPSDNDEEKRFSGQPRQNVLVEAGMSLGIFENRTVIVELGQLRTMSDIFGRHIVKMDGSMAARQELAQRLHKAGCDVNTGGTDWHSAGDFPAAVAGSVVPDSSVGNSDSGTTAPSNPPAKEDGRPSSPTPADFVNLGEHLWYLSNPPLTHVDNVVNTIRGFLNKLDTCKLRATRAAAKPLDGISLQYDLRTNLISARSMDELAALMRPIRSALEVEAKAAGNSNSG